MNHSQFSRFFRSRASFLVATAFACLAPVHGGTFRHQVNPALQTADPDVSDPIPSPDGSTIYFRTNYVESLSAEWYSVPSAGGSATLLANAGPSYEVEITSDGAYLVGESSNDLVSLSTSSGTVTNLTTLVFAADWELSPDGKWVVYEEEGALFVVPVGGGTPVEMTPTGGTDPWLDEWQFLPDSSGVVFRHRTDISADPTIWAYPLPAGPPVLLSSLLATEVGDFAVAPDSSRVVFSQDIASAGLKVYSVKPDGTGSTTISGSMVDCDGLVVSADSTKVYWRVWVTDEIYKTSLTSNTAANLITGGTLSLSPSATEMDVSPDGSRLVFFGDDGGRQDLYALSTAGGIPVRINAASSGSPEPESTSFASSFMILPNSQRVIYLCDEDNSGTVDLMSGKLDGTGSVRLDRDSMSGSDWSSGFIFDGIDALVHVLSDSSYVIYTRDELVADRDEIFAIHPNGTGRTKLNSTLSVDGSVGWKRYSHDGSVLAYTGDHNADSGDEAWVVTIPGFTASQPVDLANVTLDVTATAVGDTAGTLFYAAYQDSPMKTELYAASYTGGTPVKVNNALPAGSHSVYDMEAAPGAQQVVYNMYDDGFGFRASHGAADGSGSVSMVNAYAQDLHFTGDGSTVYFRAEDSTAPGTYILYRQALSGGLPVRVNPAGSSVWAFDLSTDETMVVMQLAMSGGTYELYSKPVAGGSAVKLNPALVSGGNVQSFDISADSTTVVFIADAVTDGTAMLFAVPIGGGSATVLESSSGTQDVRSADISPDSSRVVFIGDLTTSSVMELYSVPIGGGARVKLNAPLVAGGNVDADEFEITSDSTRVIHLADAAIDETVELYSAKIDGSSTTKISGPLVANGDVSSFDLSADGIWLAYYADQNTDGVMELFHVASSGGTVTRLHAGYSSTRDVSYDYRVVGSDHVVFRADHGGPDDQIRLFCTKVPGFITNRLDNNSLSAGDVTSFMVPGDGGYVAYLADQTSDGAQDLHVLYGVPDVTPVPNQVGLMNMPLGPLGFMATDLETPSENLTLSAVSSNHALLADSGITIGGTGASRTLTIVPNGGQWGLTTVTVKASDGVHEAQMTFDVRIIPDPNSPPTGLSLAPNGVPENAPVGTPVGTLHTLDLDPWDIHTYTLVGGATTEFAVVGNQLVTNNIFDYEATSSYNLIIRTTDFAGAFWDQNVTIQVLDVSGKPIDFSRAGVVNQRFFLSDSDFLGHFQLLDGPALERIRVESAPSNGQLVLRFPEELIDGAISGPRSVVAGDLNGDTRMDLVVAASSGGTHSLVWYEQAAGVPKFPVPAGLRTIDAGAPVAQINDVAIQDLDRDGDLDIVASCGTPNNTVYLYRNNGASPPAFVRSTLTAIPNNPVSVAVAKVDGDPEWDIVVASSGDNIVRVYRRNGAMPGLVYLPVDIASAAEPGVADVVPADLNKDGIMDLVCANRTSGEIAWLKNNGAAPPVFGRQVASTLVAGANSIAVADLNKDGNPDIVASAGTGNRINWLKHDGAAMPGFALELVKSTFNAPVAVATADFDGDTDQDVVALSATDGRVVMFENSGASTPFFIGLDIDRDCAGASCVLARDLDGNGKVDLVAGADTANDLSWYVNSVNVGAGKEIDIDETQKLFYQPALNFVGIDGFDWRGHDGVQWSINAGRASFSVYGTEYWNWLVSNFTLPVVMDDTLRSTVWGSGADADGDGILNIEEYALSGDPNDPTDMPGVVTNIAADGAANYLYAYFLLRKNEANLTYTLEVSTDLETWDSGTLVTTRVTPDTPVDPSFDEVCYKVLSDVDSTPAQFVRLRIEWALD